MSDPKGGWHLASGIRDLRARVRRDWRQLPVGARHGWLKGLAAGWAAAIAFAAALALTGPAVESGLQRIDEPALNWLVEWIPLSFDMAVFVESPGNAVVMFPVSILAAIIALRSGRLFVSLSLLAAYYMIAVVVGIGWLLWARERPDFVFEGVASPSLSAFPSGHAAQAASFYGFLGYLWIRRASRISEKLTAGLLVSLFVLAVALARLAMGTHWPSDTVAGLVIGCLWLAILITLLRRAERTDLGHRSAGASPHDTGPGKTRPAVEPDDSDPAAGRQCLLKRWISGEAAGRRAAAGHPVPAAHPELLASAGRRAVATGPAIPAVAADRPDDPGQTRRNAGPEAPRRRA
jgi:membrane-associated phospholipid phosphatase